MAEPNKCFIEAISGVNQDIKPFVDLCMRKPDGTEIICQLTIEEAREIAMHLFEAAEAAVTDSFIMRFFTSRISLNVQRAGAILLDFRALREEAGGVKNRGQDDPHWKNMQASSA